MNNFRSFFVVLLSISLTVFVFSCKEEEPLEPNEAAALLQTPNYDGSEFNNGIGGNNGGAGGNNGGGSGTIVDESFSVYIDSVLKVYPSPMYQSTTMGDQINSTAGSIQDMIQITRFSGFSVDTFDYPTIGYFKSATSTYESIDGRLIIDTLNNDFISGSFYCNVVNSSESDTISLTDGRFKIAL